MSGDAPEYDRHARRDTLLAQKLKAQIAGSGPISVERFMDACLNDPDFGYYRNARVLGRDGDFVTAPEISQVFGELIGLWCVAQWQCWGEPEAFNLVEIGAGRGTMLADAMRAARIAPGFLAATHVYVFESNSVLRAHQQRALGDLGVSVSWPDTDAFEGVAGMDADTLDFSTRDEIPNWPELGDAPTLLLANEFLDCIPVSQFVSVADAQPGWRRRYVGLDSGQNLQFMLGRYAPPMDATLPRELRELARICKGRPDGDIIETRNYANSALDRLVELVLWPFDKPHAALFIDYGHTVSAPGETLQAVRNHAYEHPLTSPGEADLTAHVDFQDFSERMRAGGYGVDGPISQAEFLGRLGVVERASKLMAANPDQAGDIEAGVARLISPRGMGGRFQVIGVRGPGVDPLLGF